MTSSETLELLAPAGTADIGIAAVNHGADAVYIGAPAFSARAAAGNSLADIERLIRHAHLFHAKVYIALNTLLRDSELEEAVRLCHELYTIGADALIIQDVGLLECDLPPLPLHASTQMDNRTPEKVAFLEATGFQQVVLARELSLVQIAEIAAQTTVALEFFIHGALCVSYSGQCYISEVMAGRSANRGKCAQFCRHKFDLLRENGEVLAKDKYLLSLQDLNLSGKLCALSDAGIRSFKIEGRLKDENYVKNITAAYRVELDALLAEGNFAPASSGNCDFSFTPDVKKSFHRGATHYFLEEKRNAIAEIRSPKATGEFLGRVAQITANTLSFDNPEVTVDIAAGDGLCCFIEGELHGFRVNRVDGEKIILKEAHPCPPGTKIYRNSDSQFSKILQNSICPRKLKLKIHCYLQQNTLTLSLCDEDGITSTTSIEIYPETARQEGQGKKTARRQLIKTGGTPFTVEEIEVELEGNPFLPTAQLNELRRLALENHSQKRRENIRRAPPSSPSNTPWIRREVSPLDNVSNKQAIQFFERHGVHCEKTVRDLRPASEPSFSLMQTRYCVKYQLNICPKIHGKAGISDPTLILSDRQGKYALFFHCKRCEMELRKLP